MTPETQTAEPTRPGLRRSLSLPLLILYGMGTTVGAGIYALTGEIAGTAGIHAPASFLIAGAIAGLSGFTFAELSARFPKTASEAVYVQEGLGVRGLPLVVGLLVVLAASVSAATIANGFVGYLGEIAPINRSPALVGLILLLVGIAVWGIGESVRVAGAITLVEIGGLLVVTWGARDAVGPATVALLTTPPAWEGLFAGSLLAFYAFLGFEDMVNVAEEVKDAPRTLPRAILATLGLTLVLYALIAAASVGTLAPETLATSDAPLVRVWEESTGSSGAAIAWISIAAMVNGALIQIIMASRVLYGLANRGWLPSALARVGARTRTPVLGTGLVGGIVALLALAFPLGPLARTTSILTLAIFMLVNAALWRLKRQPAPDGIRSIPRIIPVLGFGTTLGLLVFELVRRLT